MGKRGPKPKGKVNIKWSPDFAYAIGLIVTDGNVSQTGGRVTLVSKDMQQIKNFMKALHIRVKIGVHGPSKDKLIHRVQFKDVLFVNFLNSIGIMPAKSKIVADIKIPDKYFFDFLRGSFDGDGSVYSYMDKRWKSSFMFYISFTSASHKHIKWLRQEIKKRLEVSGHISSKKNDDCQQLKYAKAESFKIIKKMYKNKRSIFLKRKKLKIDSILAIVSKQKARVM